MPKDYRERIIDERIPRVVTMHPKRSTTAVDPEEALPPGVYSTVVSLEPGDGVLWFLRLATSDPSPTGRMVDIVTTAGAAVTFDYTTQVSGWVNYIQSFQGDFELDALGDPVQDDTIYAVWDQFEGFSAGDYRIQWSIPATARANVEGAILLNGVSLTSQGNFYNGRYTTPTWEAYYTTGGGDYNNFPVSVTTANHSLVYGIWEMTLSVTNPAGYTSVPGTTHLTYQFTDAADLPALNSTMVARQGAATGSTFSVTAPTEGGKGVGLSTDYWFSAIVLHSAAGITYTTVTFDA
jgi:hypothetical protein